MKYDEDVAKKIIEAQGMSLDTLRVWKHRNKIPDRYVAGYKAQVPLTKKQIELQGLVIDFFAQHPLRVLSTLPRYYADSSKLYDIVQGDVNYSKQELLQVITALKDINLSIEKMLKKGVDQKKLIEMVREFGIRKNVISLNGLVKPDANMSRGQISYFFSRKGQQYGIFYERIFEKAFDAIKALNSDLQQIIRFASVHL